MHHPFKPFTHLSTIDRITICYCHWRRRRKQRQWKKETTSLIQFQTAHRRSEVGGVVEREEEAVAVQGQAVPGSGPNRHRRSERTAGVLTNVFCRSLFIVYVKAPAVVFCGYCRISPLTGRPPSRSHNRRPIERSGL
ncbi:hypothetical protein HanIR_Chr01g0043961 [Helianthus annuus]|nr:hypothetical protein HanIR_Chr01g0043961 [Helianthus annuus]